MVNDAVLNMPSTDGTLSTKACILGCLRERGLSLRNSARRQPEPVSGEVMAARIGVSRVAVWKAVQALRAAGYGITGDEKGYLLESQEDEDFLFPWEFGERERSFFHWDTTDSTMNRARDLAERGISAAVAVAETQTKGRGRNGRGWFSDRGGLFFTLLSRPRLAAADYTMTAMAAHVAVCSALSRLTGMQAELHWPNDVYVEGRKIAGVLTEFHAEGDRVKWISLGIGVNINNPIPGSRFASCGGLNERPVSRRAALSGILEQMESIRYDSPEELRKRWNSLAYGRGRPVTAVISGNTEDIRSPGKVPPPDAFLSRGRFMGIDSRGRGVIKSGGELKRFSPGSVSFLFHDEIKYK